MVELETLIWLTGIIITIVWGSSMIAATITGQYEGMQISTPVMLVYAGFLFAKHNTTSKRKGDSDA